MEITSSGKFREMVRINGKAIKSPSFSKKSDASDWKIGMLAKRLREKQLKVGVIVVNDVHYIQSHIQHDVLMKHMKDLFPKLIKVEL